MTGVQREGGSNRGGRKWKPVLAYMSGKGRRKVQSLKTKQNRIGKEYIPTGKARAQKKQEHVIDHPNKGGLKKGGGGKQRKNLGGETPKTLGAFPGRGNEVRIRRDA